MDHQSTFARHFARLVSLLLDDASNTDEQKGALRALVTLARSGPVTVERRDGTLTAGGEPLSDVLAGVSALSARMTAHGTARLEVDRDATAADVLRVARRLASAPGATTTAPAHATARLAAHPAPDGAPGSPPATPAPGAASASAAVPHADAPTGALPDMELGELLDDEIAAALARSTPFAAMPAVPEPERRRAPGGGLFDHFATRESSAAHEQLLARLDAEPDPSRLIELLDELAVRVEQVAATEPHVATEIFRRVVRRERDAHDLEVKRAFVHTVKRLAKPALLREVVRDLVRAPEDRDRTLAVLTRTGEDGADAVIEQLAAEEGRAERRAFFDALVQLQAGVPTLVHMLGDARWYVARNAAALLGEMKAREAEPALAGLLHHDDERVRHAATVALMRLGTPRALPTIRQALTDTAPQLRIQAAAALVGRRESNITAMLLRALDDERDDEVIAAYLAALGKLGTSEAVERLVAIAAPDKGLFRRKPVEQRVAAVQALADAGTPEAVSALTGLREDKADAVRAAATSALRRRAAAAPPAG